MTNALRITKRKILEVVGLQCFTGSKKENWIVKTAHPIKKIATIQ